MRGRLQLLYRKVVAEPAAFAWLCRLGALGLCVLWAHHAYVLGWTEQLVGSVQGGSAWSLRDIYAGHGWDSLRHLSVVNIAKAVMVVPLLVVLAYAIGWPRLIHARGLASRFIFLGCLMLMGIFSYLNRDIPFNFYGSRYFLPTVVPLLLLAFGIALAKWPPLASVATLAGLVAAAAYWTLGLVTVPAHQGNLAFLAEVAERTRGSDVIFLVGPPSLARSSQVAIMGLTSVPVVFIDAERVGEGRGRALVDDYMEALGARDAALVSNQRLPLGGEAAKVVLETSIIPFRIAYNTGERHRVASEIHVSRYRDDASVLRHPHPQWTVGGTMRLPLSKPQEPRGRFLLIRTGGGWSWAHKRGGLDPVLEVFIDGEPAPEHRVQGSNYYFAVPDGVLGNKSLEIRSTTFVPAEIGINADQRALGVDVVAVRFVEGID